MNAVLQENTQDAELKLKKSHIRLMRHPETCLFAGVILMGESSVRRDIPTAYTDGVNKRYGYDFVMKIDMPELNGLVLHDNGHVMFPVSIQNRVCCWSRRATVTGRPHTWLRLAGSMSIS